MKVQEVREIAKQRGIKAPAAVKKADLIRSVQQAEGNDVCFDSGRSESCGQQACQWREDCV